MDRFNVFLEARGITHKMTPEILMVDYYSRFKHCDNRRFSDAVEWLKENYSVNRFPSPQEFRDGLAATAKPTYTKSEKPERIDREEFSKNFKRILWGLTIMKKIEDTVKKNDFERESYKIFIHEKMLNNEILNTATNKWQSAQDKRNFEASKYFDPREFYPVKMYS